MKKHFWTGRRVFLTGHTGFKGGWLSLWLSHLGAEVAGFSLEPPTDPSFFDAAGVAGVLHMDLRGDIRDGASLKSAMQAVSPEIVLHLAAQPLVRHSYVDPVATYATNVMGTVNLFEAVRATPSVNTVVNITTDKCYENREWVWPYREDDAMGGYDPYSSSKGCAELVTSAYRRSFMAEAGIGLASARAGNVIGGGDWASDRLVPDFLRAISRRETLTIRSPHATRPWQHVLEPLSGYLTLAQALHEKGESFSEGWNFGPEEVDARSVDWIVRKLVELKPETRWQLDNNIQPHEAGFLMLSSAKAKQRLGWHPRWRLSDALAKTVEWHSAWMNKEDMRAVSVSQIKAYENAAANV